MTIIKALKLLLNNKMPIKDIRHKLLNYKGKADIFISTWALSESSKFSQDYVVEKRWFGAKHLMFAYQKSNRRLPDAQRLGRLAKMDGATILPVSLIQNNYYAFR